MTAHALVTEHVAAFNAHDPARLLAGFALDVVWATGTDVFRGRDELRELFDPGLWELAPALTVRSLVAEGDRAAAELHERLVVDGVAHEFDIAVFFEFADGLIRTAKVYREGSADL